MGTRRITESVSQSQPDVPHFFLTKDEVAAFNNTVMALAPGAKVDITAIDAAPSDVTVHMQEQILAAARNKDINHTGNIPYLLCLKIGQLCDVTANVAIEDGVINGTECHLRDVELNPFNQKFPKFLWVEFTDTEIGQELHRTADPYYRAKPAKKWTPLPAIWRTFLVKHDQRVTQTQFPLRLAAARTVHVAQSSTYQNIIVDMSTNKKCPKYWWEHMHYVAFSRAAALQGLQIVNVNPECIHVSDKVKDYLSREKKDMTLCFTLSYKTQSFTVIYNNICSLPHKWCVIKTNHHICSADIVFLSETWLRQEQRVFELDNFCGYRMDSVVKKGHRGMMMFVLKKLTVLEQASVQTNSSEIMLCVVDWNNVPVCVIGIYKPPQASQTNFLADLDKKLFLLMSTPVVLLGDFNLDCSKETGQMFVDKLHQKYTLKQVIEGPTTLAGSTIDLVFTNMDNVTAQALATTWSTHNLLSVQVPL